MSVGEWIGVIGAGCGILAAVLRVAHTVTTKADAGEVLQLRIDVAKLQQRAADRDERLERIENKLDELLRK